MIWHLSAACDEGLMQAARPTLQFEGLEGLVLRGGEKLATEDTLGGAAVQGFFGGEAREMGVVVFLRKMREDEIARAGVEDFVVGKIFADRVIGKMAGAAEHELLDDPRVAADLEHVEIVIGFEDEAIGVAQMDFD